jgi:hypothetical protein
MELRRAVVGADLLQKILAFRSFQIVQHVSKVRIAIALRLGEIEPDMKVHQELMEMRQHRANP